MGMIKLPNGAVEFFMANVRDIFESGALAEGSWNKKSAEWIKNFTDAKKVIVTTSNGSGMVALLQVYNEYYGRKKVLIQSNTMYGVKTMVKSGNCDLIGYIDCNCETLMPTIEDVKNAISLIQDTKDLIILLTHIGGYINPDIEKIATFCKENNIILLEDCAHSFSATLNGKHSGTFGDAGVYSFYATKALFTGEGGIVVTNDEKIGDLVQRFTIYDRFEQEMEIGINIRQSEMQALLLYGVLQDTQKIIENKRTIAQQYKNVCDKLGIKYIDQDENGQKGNYYKFILLDKNCNASETFKDIKTKTSPVYDYALGSNQKVANSHICLPIWYNQEDAVTNKAIEELKALKG